MVSPRILVLVAAILAGALARILPHPPNFTPIEALALFAGAHFASKRLAFAVPLCAMLLSDAILGFHRGMFVVYGCFAVIVTIGLWLRAHRGTLPVVMASLASSLFFFGVTNFAVWAFGTLYPPTLAGLAACYVAAIPFFQNTVMGDLFYVTVLFGGFALAERRWPILREAPATAA
ncbi:MAG: hypothetical protein PHQ04_12345 [Opitutaceae bacterium]|nr:hypothetical protein [Opitutaceae bacterium]